MKVLEDELRTLLTNIEMGGGEKARARAKQSGKLLVRERRVFCCHFRPFPG